MDNGLLCTYEDDATSNGVVEKPKNEEEKVFMTSKEFFTGLAVFVIGIGVGIIFYVLGYLAVCFFDFHYAIKAISELTIALLLLVALDKAMGEKPSRMKAAILVTLIIIFIIMNFIGYNNSINEKAKVEKAKVVENHGGSYVKSETFVFTGAERWATNVVFSKGQEYKIMVQGVSVNLVNGDSKIELKPKKEPYVFKTDSGGSPTFDGIVQGRGRSTVTVEWY